MFDLEERIRHWRQAQAHALGGRVEVLDELESHLREEMQRLVTAGRRRPAPGKRRWRAWVIPGSWPPSLARCPRRGR
jgi:hypothetical protein